MKDDMDKACYFTGEIHTQIIQIHKGRERFESRAQIGISYTRNAEEVVWEVIAWMHVAEGRNQW